MDPKTLPIVQIPAGGDTAVIEANAGADLLENKKTRRKTQDAPPLEIILGESGTKYLFRSRMGTIRGEVTYAIPGPEDWWDDPDDDPSSLRRKSYAKAYKQAYMRRHDAEERKLIEQAIEDNGGKIVTFIQVPPVYNDLGTQDGTKTEVWYKTDSDAIAELLRREIRKGTGDFKFIYEVDQSHHFIVGNKKFANTTRGLQLANIHMQETGVTTIELEAKAR